MCSPYTNYINSATWFVIFTMSKTISNIELHEEIVNSVMNGLSQQSSLRHRSPSIASQQNSPNNYSRYESHNTSSDVASRAFSNPESRYTREVYRPSHYQTHTVASRFNEKRSTSTPRNTDISTRVGDFVARSHAALKNGDNLQAKHYATMARMALKL